MSAEALKDIEKKLRAAIPEDLKDKVKDMPPIFIGDRGGRGVLGMLLGGCGWSRGRWPGVPFCFEVANALP